MHYPEQDEGHEFMMDAPPSAPAGSAPVTFEIPIPTIEQVAGEIARQIIASHIGYDKQRLVQNLLDEAMVKAVNSAIEKKIAPLIDQLLEKPMRPTDTFGNPVGEPTSLSAFITQRVQGWADDMVDKDGKSGKSDHYNRERYVPRINWLVADVVNRELKSAIDTQVQTIIREIKARGEKQIASQVAERISSLIIRTP